MSTNESKNKAVTPPPTIEFEEAISIVKSGGRIVEPQNVNAETGKANHWYEKDDAGGVNILVRVSPGSKNTTNLEGRIWDKFVEVTDAMLPEGSQLRVSSSNAGPRSTGAAGVKAR